MRLHPRSEALIPAAFSTQRRRREELLGGRCAEYWTLFYLPSGDAGLLRLGDDLEVGAHGGGTRSKLYIIIIKGK